MLNIFIKKLTIKDLNTVRGAAQKYTIITDEDKFYDSWVDAWNKDWKEGQTLQIQESQIVSREYNGKLYFTIKAPPKRNSSTGSAASSELIKAIQGLNQKMDLLILQQKRALEFLEGTASTNHDDSSEEPPLPEDQF